jgi:DNA-binding LacI/PurR family transcriptional regulator
MTSVSADRKFVPIYQQLVDEYKQSILTHLLKPGDRVDSINVIQERHSVSRETAKLVLKILAREGFIIQYPGKGSFVADLRPRQKTWAVVLPNYSIQYEDLLGRLARHAALAGRSLHHFVDYYQFDEEILLVGRLIQERYESIMVIPTLDESKTADFYGRLSTQGTVVVLLDHTMTGSYFAYAVQSYDLGVQRAMHHLLDNSRGTIAFVRNEVWAGKNMIQELMEETYKQILLAERPSATPFVIERASMIAANQLSAGNVDGIFCCDDTDAVRVIGRLAEQGIAIPGQARLVSYGNTDLARYFTPRVTSIDPHNEELSATITDIILRKLGGESIENAQYVVQPELIVRET